MEVAENYYPTVSVKGWVKKGEGSLDSIVLGFLKLVSLKVKAGKTLFCGGVGEKDREHSLYFIYFIFLHPLLNIYPYMKKYFVHTVK